jgi:hypothetical protein
MYKGSLDWLIEYANNLGSEYDGKVHIRKVLGELDIDLHKRSGSTKKDRRGSVYRSSNGNYSIELYRAEPPSRSFSPGERFTIAHELGHVIIDKKIGWSPSSNSEYHQREKWCNLFAANLLVPTKHLEDLNIASPVYLMEVTEKLRHRFGVSAEVTARRLSQVHQGIAIFQGKKKKNADNQLVVEINWSGCSINSLRLTRHRHLLFETVLGSKLLWLHGQGRESINIPPVGSICAHWNRGRVTSSIVSNQENPVAP